MPDTELSDQEKKVKDILDKANKRVKEIDDLIGNLPPDKGPSQELVPPGFAKTRQIGTKEQTVFSYKQQQSAIHKETDEDVNKIKENASPAIRQKIDDQVERFKNPEKNLTEKRDENKKDMLGSSHEQKNQVDKKENKSVEDKPKQDQEKEGDVKEKMSMGMRFVTKYNSLDFSEKANKEEKTNEKSKSAETKSPSKENSLSEKFFQNSRSIGTSASKDHKEGPDKD